MPNTPIHPAPRHSIPVQVGHVIIGGQAPVVVQSMTNTDTADVAATVKQVRELAQAGMRCGKPFIVTIDFVRPKLSLEQHHVTMVIGKIIDITNPLSPQLVGGVTSPGDAWGVAGSGTYAYLADDDAGLQIIDISNPAFPYERGDIDPSSYNDVAVAVMGTVR